MFEYIEGSLEKIRNPENVMMIKTIKGDMRGYLGAYMKDGALVRLTKPKSLFTYPFEPLAYLNSQLGKFYWENFDVIIGHIAINKKYLESFTYCDSLESKKRYDLYAIFNNGISQKIASPEKKYFDKKMLLELEEKFGVKIERKESGITID